LTTRVVTAHLPKDLAEKRRCETLLALKELDAGRVVEHAEIQAWAAGLGRAMKSKASNKPSG